MLFANEIFTIHISDLHARLIWAGLDLLKKSDSIEKIGHDELLKIITESFHNLSNGKVLEVNEVTITNPLNIEVIKREKLPEITRNP